VSLSESAKRVIDLIDEKELVDLAVAMGNITAPSGYEQPMADFVLSWLTENGFERSFQQPICDGRSNTIGILNGQGGGRNLIFNSHMDSEQGMPMRVDEPPPPVPFSQVERELQRVVSGVGLGGSVECFMARKGYAGKNVEPLVDAICAAHVAV
jgi:acetylornithine deacetylase/succinyl-diaminopimelate desuccinylase-like protein